MRATDRIALLRSAIDNSGLTIKRFAEDVMVRDERTIHRWLSGQITIPAIVMQRLKSLV